MAERESIVRLARISPAPPAQALVLLYLLLAIINSLVLTSIPRRLLVLVGVALLVYEAIGFRSNLLFWRQQTRVIPLVTLAAGAANIGLNLWLVPRYGAIAAAWSTLAAYAILLILTWRSAERLHPFPYEYRRLGLMAGLALALFLTGQLLPFPSPELEVAGRVLLWLAFPFGLVALGTLDRVELAVLTRLVRGRKPPPAEPAGPVH